MTRFFFNVLIALVLSVLETSFFASFQGIIRFTPLVFAISVYLIQHHDVHSAAWWLLLHGIFLDLLHIGYVPFSCIAYGVAAGVALLSAEKIFSNRSIYGVMGCAFLSYFSFAFVEMSLRGIDALMEKHLFYWGTFFQDFERGGFMLMVTLIVLFSLAKRIRFLIKNSVLIPHTRQTF